MVNAAATYFEASLLSSVNIVFAKVLAMLIKFKTHHLDFLVKILRMDNAKKFRSQHFEDYCLVTSIELTYSVPYEHSQNGLVKVFIKKIQLINRPLLIHVGLPSHLWAHAILHAATLLRYIPTLFNDYSPLELLSGQKPDVSHFGTFGCQVWIPIAEPNRKTIGQHRLEGIYDKFDFPSIIRYLVPCTEVMYKARFQNCQFDENKFPYVLSSQPSPLLEFLAPELLTMNLDPKSALADTEVKKLLDIKALAKHLPDGFTNTPCVIRNPFPGDGSAAISILPKKHSIEPPNTSVKRLRSSNHIDCFVPSKLEPLLCTTDENQYVMSFVHNITTLESDPLTLDQTKSSLDWLKWLKAL